MILDPANPSSIYSCLRAARESARSVRGAITSEMYEDLNSPGSRCATATTGRCETRGVSEFLDWVKMRSHLFRGVTFGTMLRDEAYHFIRLGTHLERADNTARILDVKYHILLPSAADVGGAVDYYQWAALLRSVSGFESYRKIYRDVITPRRVAELLILRDDMPRSLHACMNFIHETLEMLCDNSSREVRARRGRAPRGAALRPRRRHHRQGLHEYLMDFLERDLDARRRHQPPFPRAAAVKRRALSVESAFSARAQAHDLLCRHVARRRNDLRVGLAHQRGRRPDRTLLQDAHVRAAGRPRDRDAVVGQPVDHAERGQHARAARTLRPTGSSICGTRRRCSRSRGCWATRCAR